MTALIAALAARLEQMAGEYDAKQTKMARTAPLASTAYVHRAGWCREAATALLAASGGERETHTPEVLLAMRQAADRLREYAPFDAPLALQRYEPSPHEATLIVLALRAVASLPRWTCPECGDETASDLDLLDSGTVLTCGRGHHVVVTLGPRHYAAPEREALALCEAVSAYDSRPDSSRERWIEALDQLLVSARALAAHLAVVYRADRDVPLCDACVVALDASEPMPTLPAPDALGLPAMEAK